MCVSIVTPCNREFVLWQVIFFFMQKTAYERRMSEWSSDVCSSDLPGRPWSTASMASRRGTTSSWFPDGQIFAGLTVAWPRHSERDGSKRGRPRRHCEERSDEAIQRSHGTAPDCFALRLAMTGRGMPTDCVMQNGRAWGRESVCRRGWVEGVEV